MCEDVLVMRCCESVAPPSAEPDKGTINRPTVTLQELLVACCYGEVLPSTACLAGLALG